MRKATNTKRDLEATVSLVRFQDHCDGRALHQAASFGKELRGTPGIHGYHVARHAPLGAPKGSPLNCWGARQVDHRQKATAR